MVNLKHLLRIAAGLALLLATGCNTVRMHLDESGIKELSETMLADYKPGSPQALRDFLAGNDFWDHAAAYAGVTVTVAPLKSWSLEVPGKQVVAERISFPSRLKRPDGEQDTAVFYLYRSGELKNHKVILWVPGYGVSDFAFMFIQRFFKIALAHGYDVMFYNIPFHLERAEKGKKNGQGLFTADALGNIETTLAAISELRTGLAYLRGKGVTTVGGWGGSIGAAYLLLASTLEDFDHLFVMIPIVDWNTLLANPAMKAVNVKNEENGFTPDLMCAAYDRISPLQYPSRTAVERTMIAYADLDQLTPSDKTLAYAGKFQIKNIRGYAESHSTILLNRQMYDDYADFLDHLK